LVTVSDTILILYVTACNDSGKSRKFIFRWGRGWLPFVVMFQYIAVLTVGYTVHVLVGKSGGKNTVVENAGSARRISGVLIYGEMYLYSTVLIYGAIDLQNAVYLSHIFLIIFGCKLL
jgi:hypothetical protein